MNNNKFNQVCVWPGTVLGETTIEEFEKDMFNIYNTRIKYIEEIKTKPDKDDAGNIIKNTGNRNDILFYVHDDDISHFAIPRLKTGIRWIEDVLASSNSSNTIYPDHVFDYVTWNNENINFPKQEFQSGK